MLSPAALRAQIASRTLGPVYVLTGPDDQEKTAMASLFGDLVEPELRAFNVERFYGTDAKPRDIVEAARTLPMMVDRRIVVVLQADRLLNPRRRGTTDEDDEEPGDVEALVEYVNSPESAGYAGARPRPAGPRAARPERARPAPVERHRPNHQGTRPRRADCRMRTVLE